MYRFQSSSSSKRGCYFQKRVFKLLRALFQSSSSSKRGCYSTSPHFSFTLNKFQSSSSSKRGCYRRRILSVRSARYFNPHPLRKEDATSRLICCLIWMDFDFNPHPLRKEDATTPRSRKTSQVVNISILILFEKRMLPPITKAEAAVHIHFNPHPLRKEDATKSQSVNPHRCAPISILILFEKRMLHPAPRCCPGIRHSISILILFEKRMLRCWLVPCLGDHTISILILFEKRMLLLAKAHSTRLKTFQSSSSSKRGCYKGR